MDLPAQVVGALPAVRRARSERSRIAVRGHTDWPAAPETSIPCKLPTVDYALQKCILFGKLRQLVHLVEAEDMRAIIAGPRVVAAAI